MELPVLLLGGQVIAEISKLAIQCLTVHSICMQGGTGHIVFCLLANSTCFNAAAGLSWLLSLVAYMLPIPARADVIWIDWRLTLGLRHLLGKIFLDCAGTIVGWTRYGS